MQNARSGALTRTHPLGSIYADHPGQPAHTSRRTAEHHGPIPGINVGIRMIVEGTAGGDHGHLTILNPIYQFLPRKAP